MLRKRKRATERAEKEAARKAELLAKEVVAAEGMELTPDQVLAAAEAGKPLNFKPVLTCLLAPRSRLNQQLRRVKLPVTVTRSAVN